MISTGIYVIENEDDLPKMYLGDIATYKLSYKQDKIIKRTLSRFYNIMDSLNYMNDSVIYRPRIFIAKPLPEDTAGFTQPIICELGLQYFRIYLNSLYINDIPDNVFEKIVMHELIHTVAEKNILKHGSVRFDAICCRCNSMYGYNPKKLIPEEIEGSWFY